MPKVSATKAKAKAISRNELMGWMHRFCWGSPNLYHASQGGECDAFAKALAAKIEEHWPGTKTAPVIAERYRIGDDSGDVIEHNPFSHVLLEVTLADGKKTMVDGSGPEADITWEENWIQPDEDDELEPCEDTFEYTVTTFEGIQARRKIDRKGRGINPREVGKFKVALGKYRVAAAKKAGRKP